jgi:hypothetical protein
MTGDIGMTNAIAARCGFMRNSMRGRVAGECAKAPHDFAGREIMWD